MNNASKGRCVTVTPRGIAADVPRQNESGADLRIFRTQIEIGKSYPRTGIFLAPKYSYFPNQ
jgi:hypothetical protein